MSDNAENEELIRIFATIHFKSEKRPDGFAPEEIEEINNDLNAKRKDPGQATRPEERE